MKKLLQWVLPAFIGIAPALGMDNIGIIDDSFFIRDNMARSIVRIVEHGPKLMAQVMATDQNETRNKLVEALCATVGWQNNDLEHYAQEIVKTQVFCGPDFLEMSHTRAFHTPYVLLKESEIRALQGVALKENNPLPVGAIIDVCKFMEYKRPDGSLYNEIGDTLYQLLLEETTVTLPIFAHQERAWTNLTGGNRNRADIQLYDHKEVTQTIYAISIENPEDRIEKEKKVIPTFTKYRNGRLLGIPAKDYPHAQIAFPQNSVITPNFIG